jgi:hypothetical protein
MLYRYLNNIEISSKRLNPRKIFYAIAIHDLNLKKVYVNWNQTKLEILNSFCFSFSLELEPFSTKCFNRNSSHYHLNNSKRKVDCKLNF